jgi:hypothetical protein
MGWGGFEDPAEQRAAAKAAEAMAAQRATADAQTQILAEAIRDGFAVLAEAVLVAAGATPTGPLAHVYDGPLEDVRVYCPPPAPPEADPAMDDLLRAADEVRSKLPKRPDDT